MPEALPDYDPEPLARLRQQIGAATTAEIQHEFLEELQARLDRLRQLSDGSDAASLRREAHSLKSTAASVGLMALSAAAGSLERCGAGLPPAALADAAALLQAMAARGLALLPAAAIRR